MDHAVTHCNIIPETNLTDWIQQHIVKTITSLFWSYEGHIVSLFTSLWLFSISHTEISLGENIWYLSNAKNNEIPKPELQICIQHYSNGCSAWVMHCICTLKFITIILLKLKGKRDTIAWLLLSSPQCPHCCLLMPFTPGRKPMINVRCTHYKQQVSVGVLFFMLGMKVTVI